MAEPSPRERLPSRPLHAQPATTRPPSPLQVPPSPASLLALQGRAGNRATGALLARWELSDLRVPVVGTAIGSTAGFWGSVWVWRPWFLQHAYDERQRPIFSAEWDAWGHCIVAASTAAWGTNAETWALGEAREEVQDMTTGQDSHEIDSHNQAVGRAIGSAHGFAGFDVLAPLCFDAYREGRLRIGPNRSAAWLPWCGPHDVWEHLTTQEIFHDTREHEGRRWFPRVAPGPGGYSGAAADWVEAIECGDRGTAVGGHLDHPGTPLPAD